MIIRTLSTVSAHCGVDIDVSKGAIWKAFEVVGIVSTQKRRAIRMVLAKGNSECVVAWHDGVEY
jgi:hypothetical protein